MMGAIPAGRFAEAFGFSSSWTQRWGMSTSVLFPGTGTYNNLEQIVHLVDSGKLESGL